MGTYIGIGMPCVATTVRKDFGTDWEDETIVLPLDQAFRIQGPSRYRH